MREWLSWGDEREPGPNYGVGLTFAALEPRPTSGLADTWVGSRGFWWASGQLVGMVFRQHSDHLGGQVGDSELLNIKDWFSFTISRRPDIFVYL